MFIFALGVFSSLCNALFDRNAIYKMVPLNTSVIVVVNNKLLATSTLACCTGPKKVCVLDVLNEVRNRDIIL
jgi:hypothetical protein